MIINEPEQINDLTLPQLASQDVFDQLQAWAQVFKEDARFNSDAVQVRRALEEKLSLPDAIDELRRKYIPILLVCYFSGLFTSNEIERLDLIKTQTLAAFKDGLPVQAFLDDYFLSNSDILFDHLERKKILQALRENQEPLVGQTLGSWLIRYAASSPTGKRSGSLSRLNFLNIDADLKKATKEEKTLLLKALELFDFLEYPDEEKAKADWDVIVGGDEGKETVMKMSEFQELKQGKKIKEKLSGGALEYVIANRPSIGECITYLQSQFPEPTDFKHVLKLLNDLKRRGYPEYLEAVYFDETDKKFHWKEF